MYKKEMINRTTKTSIDWTEKMRVGKGNQWDLGKSSVKVGMLMLRNEESSLSRHKWQAFEQLWALSIQGSTILAGAASSADSPPLTHFCDFKETMRPFIMPRMHVSQCEFIELLSNGHLVSGAIPSLSVSISITNIQEHQLV